MKKEPQNISLDTLFELSEFFKFFGDTTRIRVIHLLLSGEMSVSAIAEKLNLEQSVVSHQLRIITLSMTSILARFSIRVLLIFCTRRRVNHGFRIYFCS